MFSHLILLISCIYSSISLHVLKINTFSFKTLFQPNIPRNTWIVKVNTIRQLQMKCAIKTSHPQETTWPPYFGLAAV